jgi:hypothetical protein
MKLLMDCSVAVIFSSRNHQQRVSMLSHIPRTLPVVVGRTACRISDNLLLVRGWFVYTDFCSPGGILHTSRLWMVRRSDVIELAEDKSGLDSTIKFCQRFDGVCNIVEILDHTARTEHLS